jgi:ribosomal protein L11 methyltransferase
LNYTETRVYTTTAGVEPVVALLMRHGVTEVSVEDDKDLNTVLDAKDWLGWDYIGEGAARGEAAEAVLTFYTGDSAEGRALLAEIRTGLMMLKADEQYGEYGADADFGRLYAESEALTDEWKEKWKEGFRTFRVTDRIVIRPPWEAPPTRDADAGITPQEDIVITIDPGMAFGTGSHGTTAMCLAALERAVRPGMSVLDVGTGSGVLAIAAALLGAAAVTAVEYDADAVLSASANFGANGVTDRVKLVKGDIREADGIAGDYDIVVANLTSGLVRGIAGRLAALTRRGGGLIVSGLLEDEEDKVREAIESAGFRVSGTEKREEWLMLCADFS